MTCFCHVTDGRDDAEMRSWSRASIRKFCPGHDVITVTADGLYGEGLADETVVDATATWHTAFGKEKAGDPCAGNRRFPKLVFLKFLLPLVPELSGYDSIVAVDGDMEAVSPAFAAIVGERVPKDADVLMCPSGLKDADRCRNPGLARSNPNRWASELTYRTAGLVVMRSGDSAPGYLFRVRQAFAAEEAERYFLPEEYAANFFLVVADLDPRYHTIPDMPEAGRTGAKGERLANAWCLHYGGPRKRAVRESWKRRFAEGRPTDPLHLIET